MSYAIIIKNPPGIICMADVDFKCPNCKKEYGELFYHKQLEKSTYGFIYKRCKQCGEKIGISTDMRGDVVVWLKKDEPKPVNK